MKDEDVGLVGRGRCNGDAIPSVANVKTESTVFYVRDEKVEAEVRNENGMVGRDLVPKAPIGGNSVYVVRLGWCVWWNMGAWECWV